MDWVPNPTSEAARLHSVSLERRTPRSELRLLVDGFEERFRDGTRLDLIAGASGAGGIRPRHPCAEEARRDRFSVFDWLVTSIPRGQVVGM